METIKIMLVEHSAMQRKVIRRMINGTETQAIGFRFEVFETSRLSEALDHISVQKPNIILLALFLEDSTGLETVVQVRSHAPTLPIVVLTGMEGEEIGMKAIQEGAQDYLVKNTVDKDLLKRTVLYALERGRLLNEVKHQEAKLAKLASKLSKYLSPQIYDSIFTGKKEVKLETTRKPLTVFFSDIVDFTSTSEKMGQEQLSQWLNNYLNEMANIALRYKGTLDKFVGDAIMIFFGDPETSGEKRDAINCVLMAIEMQKKAQSLGIDIRVGIHTGTCTVGNFGSEERMDYTIIGRSVNLASRLESSAEPGKILISASTYQLIKDQIPCEPHGNIHLKGIDREIMTYWVLEDQ